jgi:hypothetical protein
MPQRVFCTACFAAYIKLGCKESLPHMRKHSTRLKQLQGMPATPVWVESRFEVLKLRYEDQVSLLRKLTDVDLQVFGGYLTVSLAFGSWLSQQQPLEYLALLGLTVIAIVLAMSTTIMLLFNFKRRVEVVATVTNLNEALGLDAAGALTPDKKINATTIFRPWRNVYYLCIWSVFFGLSLLLYSKQVRPNPALEATATGKPVGPPVGQVHVPTSEPTGLPALAPKPQR